MCILCVYQIHLYSICIYEYKLIHTFSKCMDMEKYVVDAPTYLTGTQNYMKSLENGLFEIPPSLC